MQTLGWRWSLCEDCLSPVRAEVCAIHDKVYYKKTCAGCANKLGKGGATQTLISTDVDYFGRSHGGFAETSSSASLSECKRFSTLILEMTDECNMRCPTCIAGSRPGAGNFKSLTALYGLISASEEKEPSSRILMISGGEPTIHPNIIEVLTRACESNFGRVFLITNGLKISREPEFVAKLASLRHKLEVYLQFDSLRPNVLLNIRGEDLSQVRQAAVKALDAAEIPMTLVCVVKRGLNDDDLGNVVRFAAQFPSVRGVAFQPIKATGRNESLVVENELITLADVRRRLLLEFSLDEQSIGPHPVNGENMAIGYFERTAGILVPVTSEVLYDSNGGAPQTDIGRSMYFVPRHDNGRFQYAKLFRISIVSFMDKFNFAFELIPNSVVGFTEEDGSKTPFDVHYLKNEVPVIARMLDHGEVATETSA